MTADGAWRESAAALPVPSQRWRLVWFALALHIAGLAVDTRFHDSEDRPFGVLDMLWAHGLLYLGAVATVVGGRRAVQASLGRVGCQWAGTLIAVLGVVQALALGLDVVTELADVQEGLSVVVYVLSLVPMFLGASAGAWLCRRAGADVERQDGGV